MATDKLIQTSRKPTLLWTNPTPGSSISASTLASGIDFDGFNMFLLLYEVYVGTGKYNTANLIRGYQTELFFVTDTSNPNGNVSYRYISVDNGAIAVTDGKRGDGQTNNGVCIPLKLYGIG